MPLEFVTNELMTYSDLGQGHRIGPRVSRARGVYAYEAWDAINP